MRASLIRSLVLVAGCGLYENHAPDEPPPCGAYVPQIESRDVETGACESQGGGVYCGYDYAVLPACTGPCSGLTEAACLAAASCHAVYELNNGQHFAACWEQMPSGERADGVCVGLDAWTCAAHSNCASVMTSAKSQVGFDHCIAELGGVCRGDIDCAVDQRCDAGVCAPKPACSTLATETACTARADCIATYAGYDCTCMGMVCTCKTEVFASCGTR